MFPEQKRIELFARQKTEGWDVWGLDVREEKSYTNSLRNNGVETPSLFDEGRVS